MKSVIVLFSCEEVKLNFKEWEERLIDMFSEWKWSIDIDNLIPCEDSSQYDFSIELQAYSFEEKFCAEIDFWDNSNQDNFDISLSKKGSVTKPQVEEAFLGLLELLKHTEAIKLR